MFAYFKEIVIVGLVLYGVGVLYCAWCVFKFLIGHERRDNAEI